MCISFSDRHVGETTLIKRVKMDFDNLIRDYDGKIDVRAQVDSASTSTV